MLEHGGRLKAAARRYRIAESDWLDLSTGINPNAWQVPPLPAGLWQGLPQDDDGLAEAACGYYGSSSLLAVAGSQAAIQTLPGLFAKCRVALSGVCYAEHEHAWREAGHDVARFTDDELLHCEADVVVIVNPNNPTGRLYGTQQLLALHRRLVRRGGFLIVDEAFVDATPEHSLSSCCPQDGLIVLRSVGKFFGLAGARVGFVLAEPGLLDRLAERLGPWPIAAPSRYAAQLALQDLAWQQAARASLQAAGHRLSRMLASHNLDPAGGCSLFQWVRTNDAQRLHRHLAMQGILTRYYDAPASVRFGLPGTDEDWLRLDAALMGVAR